MEARLFSILISIASRNDLYNFKIPEGVYLWPQR